MSKRVDRAVYGPSWAEVILGAFLSLVLGVVLGAVLLILRPVEVAKEEPKEPARNTVYYIEGSRDTGRGRQAPAKRKALLEGQSVTLTEEEINSLLSPGGTAPAPAKAGEKKSGKEGEAPAESSGTLTVGTPNVRIREGVMQVAAPVTINLIDRKVIAQARGGFVKRGEIFVFEPDTIYLGSCPVQRIPVLGDIVRDKIRAAQALPEELNAVWQKLANVSVEGNTLKLTMP